MTGEPGPRGGGGGRGFLLALEGGDGVGKSTQLRRLVLWLEERGCRPLVVREPGGTPLAESLRAVILDTRHAGMGAEAELFLYCAARADLYAREILPALGRGRLVVTDRSYLSSVVYQGHAGGIEPARVRELSMLATRDTVPDLFVVFDMDPAAARGRLGRKDRMEMKDPVFHETVFRGFREEAARLGARAALVDASLSEDAVHARTLEAVVPLIGRFGAERAH